MGANSGYKSTIIDFAALTVALCLVYYRQIFFGANLGTQELILNDVFALTKPTMEHTASRLLAGEIPLWNPYWYGGFPHLAVPSNAVFYPFTILFGFLSFDKAFVLSVLSHSMILAVGGYLFGRALTGSRLASVVLGLQCMVLPITFKMVGTGHLWVIFTIAWAPLGALCLWHLCQAWRPLYFYLFVLVIVLMIFGGGLQTFSYVLLWYGVLVLALLGHTAVARENTARQVAFRGLAILGGLSLGMLICAIIILPSRELLMESIRRNGVAYSYMAHFSDRWFDGKSSIFTSYGAREFAHGKVMLTMFLVSFLLSCRGRLRGYTFSMLVAILGMLLFGGMPEWFYEYVVRHLPVYGTQRGVSRISMPLSVICITLVSIGTSQVIRLITSEEKRRNYTLLVLCVAIPCLLLPLFFQSERDFATILIGSVFVAAMMRHWFRPLPEKILAGIVVACIVSEIAVGLSAAKWRELSLRTSTNAVQGDYAAFVEGKSDADRVAVFKVWAAVNAGQRIYEVQGFNLRMRQRGIAGHHALMNYRYASFLVAMSGEKFFVLDERGDLVSDQSLALWRDWCNEASGRALDLLNVKYLLTLAPPLQFPSESANFTRSELNDLVVFENTKAMSPVYIFHEVEVFNNDEDALSRLASVDFPYRSRGTITGDFDAGSLSLPSRSETLVVQRMEPESVMVDVEMDTPGILTFSEVYYPGWKVSVDGGSYEDMLCIDTVFRGVYLDAGKHTVRMEYRSETIRKGALTSIAATLLFLAMICRSFWIWRREDSAGDRHSES